MLRIAHELVLQGFQTLRIAGWIMVPPAVAAPSIGGPNAKMRGFGTPAAWIKASSLLVAHAVEAFEEIPRMKTSCTWVELAAQRWEVSPQSSSIDRECLQAWPNCFDESERDTVRNTICRWIKVPYKWRVEQTANIPKKEIILRITALQQKMSPRGKNVSTIFSTTALMPGESSPSPFC